MTVPWTLLSNHGLVLLAVARNPELRLREIAEQVGITPRAAQGFINDLVHEGYLERRREGRRSRYLVRGDRPLPHPSTKEHVTAELFGALVGDPKVIPTDGGPAALVLACSDFRYQEPLRELLSEEGILATSEIFLWPGGSAALGGPHASAILEAMRGALQERTPRRVVLVAHQGCAVPGAHARAQRDPLLVGRAVVARRITGVARARKAFGVEPEMWFLTERGAQRVRPRLARSA